MKSEPIPTLSFSARRDTRVLAGGFLMLALFWAGSAFSVHSADALKPKDWNRSSLLYLPSEKLLKPMVLDFDEAAADLIWVEGILYFADAFLEHRSYEWMGHMLVVVTALNPRFLNAYEFGGTVLGRDRGEWMQTRKLLERGIAQFPENWQLRVYAAMGYKKMDSNYLAAAEILKPVALLPNVPEYVRTLSATFMEKGGSERLALAFLMDRYLHAPEAINREVFLNRLMKIFQQTAGQGADKEKVRKLLALVQTDPRSQEVVLNVLYEYLRNELSPGSQRVLGLLK